MKRIIAALAFALASTVAHADFVLLPGSITPGQDTGVFGIQTCPPGPVGCGESGSESTSFLVDTVDGFVGLAFVGISQPPDGAFSFDVEVYDSSLALVASGSGGSGVVVSPFAVFVGGPYTIEIDWEYTAGGTTTQSASWGLVAATSANAVPEPGSLALMALALVGMGVTLRKRLNHEPGTPA